MKKLVFGVAILLLQLSSTPLSRAMTIAILNSAAQTSVFLNNYYPFCTAGGGSYLGVDEYKRYYFGWDRVLTDAGILHTIIPDSGLTDGSLANIHILILSNNAGLTAEQTRAVHQWVLRGGRLLATFGSGYKQIVTADPYKESLNKGPTGGLHQLWHDPFSKLFTSQAIGPLSGVSISQSAGPTAGVSGTLPYWALGNILISRPEHFRDAFAFLTFAPGVAWGRPQPAILGTSQGKGLVVYYAFAPEFFVALALDLAGHCSLDTNYHPGASGSNVFHASGSHSVAGNGFEGAANALDELMLASINYLCGGDCTP